MGCDPPRRSYLRPMRTALLVILSLAVPASSSRAQLSAGVSLSVANRYVWRGVTRVNGWVVQPAGWGAVRLPPGELSVSAWANGELRRAGRGDLTDLGAGRRGWSELDVEVALARTLASLALAGGWTRYTFHGSAAAGGRDPARNTSEVYLRTEWLGSPLTPAIAGSCDIDRVRGCYVEGGVSLPIFATAQPRPAIALWLAPTAGWSLGQGINPGDPSQAANFNGNGLTHVDVPFAAQIQPGGGAVEPAVSFRLHTQWSRDGAARLTDATGATTRIKLWIEFGVVVTAGRPKEQRR
jgi:hypothetical protein